MKREVGAKNSELVITGFLRFSKIKKSAPGCGGQHQTSTREFSLVLFLVQNYICRCLGRGFWDPTNTKYIGY